MKQKITKNSVQWWRPFQRNTSNPKGLKFLITAMLFGLGAMSAFGQTYNAANAVTYAKGHWNDGKGLCSEFVYDCLKAGNLITNTNAINRCSNLHNYLWEHFPQIQNGSIYESFNGGTKTVELQPGDIIMAWGSGVVGKHSSSPSNHAVIITKATHYGAAHNEARGPEYDMNYMFSYRNKISIYRLSQLANSYPTSTPWLRAIGNQSSQDYTCLTMHAGDGINFYVDGKDVPESNIKVTVMYLSGEPNYQPNAGEPSSGYRGYAPKAGEAYCWYWNAPQYADSWVKIIAHNTMGTETESDDKWSNAMYVYVLPNGVNLQDTKPSITNLGNSVSNVVERNSTDGISVLIDGNGYVNRKGGTTTTEIWNKYVEVRAVLLSGTPNFGDPYSSENGEAIDVFKEATPNGWGFIPNTSWEGKYVKVIAHNMKFGTWSEPRYIKIVSTTGTGFCPTIPEYDNPLLPSNSWQTISSSIQTNGCKIYRFSATQGEKYSFKTGCGDGATANFDTQLYLYNGNGIEQEKADDECEPNRDKIEDWICPTAGYYYLKVKGYNANSGNYTLAYKKAAATTPPPASCKTPPDFDLPYTPDETWNSKDWNASVNSSNDCKVYRIYGVAGTTYELHIDPKNSFDPTLTLYNSSGVQIGNTLDVNGSGGVEYHDYTFTYTGFIYAKVQGFQTSTGQFDFSCRKAPATTPTITADSYESNNTQTTATPLNANFSGNSATVNTTSSNFHTSSDVDYYKIELPVGYNYVVTPRLHDSDKSDNGQTYTVDAKFSYALNNNGFSSTYDTYYNNINGGNFSVPNGGTLYFKVEPWTSGDMGTYLLSVNITRTGISVQPPMVITLPQTNVSQTSATLNKSITQGSEPILVQGFQYRIKGTEEWLPSSNGNLTGLNVNTTYQFRAFATTASGTTYGDPPLEFTTDNETVPSWEVGTPIASDVIATLKNGVLTIKGSGAMKDFTSTNNLPWSGFINNTWNQLTSVVVENGVTNIGKNAFNKVVNLSSVTISNTVTDIGENAFFQCTALSSITIPNSVTTIRQSAFSGCSNLSAIVIPNSVTSIGLYAFSNCSNLSSVSFGNGITNIGNYSFQNCNGLTTITIPESVTIVGYGAFQNSVGLQRVYFNATNCTSVGTKDYPAFSGCANITTAHIGSNVTNIPAYAFSGCNITEIYSKATVAPATRANSFDGIDRKTCKLYVLTCAVANEYRSNTEWNGFSSIFAEGATVPCVIEPNTISLNSAKISLSIDETKSLTITVSPSNASKSNIQWSSNNPNVATVSNEGLITAVAVGTATITATTANGKTATCMVTVSPSTGIDDITTSDLLVYPNPTTGIVNISEPSEIQVYNSFGALIITTFGTQVDLSNYANGVYFIQANGKRTTVVKK